jgi:hypothetical protein
MNDTHDEDQGPQHMATTFCAQLKKEGNQSFLVSLRVSFWYYMIIVRNTLKLLE